MGGSRRASPAALRGRRAARAAAASASPERLFARVDDLRRRRPERALEALVSGLPAALRAADHARRGDLHRLHGHVLRSLRRSREAVAAYRRAERWYRRAGDARERGRCAIGLVDAFMHLGRYEDAVHAARRGRVLLGRARDAVSLGRLLNNEGNLYHRLDLPAEALARYREARRELRRRGDRLNASLIGTNLGNCLSLLGRCAEARRMYREARTEAERSGRELDALRAEYNLRYMDFLEHRLEPALDGLARVRDEARRRRYPSLVLLTALDRAEILLRMGAAEEALEEAVHALAAADGLGMGYERAKAGTFAALAEFRLGRGARARERLERALAAFHSEGNLVWTGEVLVGMAALWWHERNPAAAAALLGAAGRNFRAARDREREGCALALLARAEVNARRLPSARRALGALATLAGRRASPRLRHLHLAAEAALARAGGDLAKARRRLRSAAREASRIATRILDEQWRSSFWGEWGWPHRELAALELRAGRVDAALEALENGRGLTLVGLTGRRAFELPREARAWAVSRLALERDRRSRVGVVEAPRVVRQRAHGGRPRTLPAQVNRAPAEIRFETLRRSLGEDVLFLDYLLDDDALALIAGGRHGFQGHPGLASVSSLRALTNSLLFSMRCAAQAPPLARPADAGLARDLERLAALVLWPALARAGRLREARSLAVVPVGPLVRMPWAALPLPDGRPLCEAYELSIVPGLRLGLTPPRAAAPSGPPLVVASDAGELENVGPETRMVLERFPRARLLSGADATAARFLELAPNAAWIHFAGHGCYRADAPHLSGLMFADRWLPAAELARIGLAARWVTLSACQTARALVRPGEEWFGLARTLLVCGARSVVASQWDIDDESALGFMTHLYSRLGTGNPLGTALAMAQADRARAGAHPLDWAGFVRLGGPSGDRSSPDGTG